MNCEFVGIWGYGSAFAKVIMKVIDDGGGGGDDDDDDNNNNNNNNNNKNNKLPFFLILTLTNKENTKYSLIYEYVFNKTAPRY